MIVDNKRAVLRIRTALFIFYACYLEYILFFMHFISYAFIFPYDDCESSVWSSFYLSWKERMLLAFLCEQEQNLQPG